jgi:Uma2 family endonuclease
MEMPNRCNYRMNPASSYTYPAPGPRHQTVVLKTASLLLRYVEAHNLGHVLHAPCDVILSRGTIVQPDICFVRKNRTGIIFDQYLRGIPDLAIEISPHDCRTKIALPLKGILSRHGVREFWDIDYIKGTVEILMWSELGYVSAGRYGSSDRLTSSLFPGFTLPLSGIF